MNKEVLTLNKLGRMPCLYLHTLWWDKLTLSIWREKYKVNNILAQRLNKIVLHRYGYKTPWFTSVPEKVKPWLALLPRLSFLTIATGLMSQAAPDYLWSSEYRVYLKKYFSKQQIKQLMSIPVKERSTEIWEADCFLEKSQCYAASILLNYWKDESFLPLIATTLPPIDHNNLPVFDDIETQAVIRWLFRLNRLL